MYWLRLIIQDLKTLKRIIDEICKGISPSRINKISTIEDRRDAIKVAYDMAKSGDIILIAGKGHEISNNRF